MKTERIHTIERITAETEIQVEINLDGIYVLANAKKEILDIKIEHALYQEGIAKLEAKLNQAIKQVLSESQKAMVEEVKKSMGGMDLGFLGSLLKS